MRIPVGFEILRQTLALRHYRRYVLGNITSNLGMWTQRVAMGWLTWELTHSTAWLGIIAICEAGPALLIGIFAGAVIDRVDQFKLLRLAQSWSRYLGDGHDRRALGLAAADRGGRSSVHRALGLAAPDSLGWRARA
jgi:Transmembrane secretion effector